MDSLSLIKSLSFVIMFLLIILTGNIPLRMKSFSSNQKLISLTSAFSGGLFLSVSLIHLAPQASKKFDEYYNGTTHDEMDQNQLEISDIEDPQMNKQESNQHSSHSSMNSNTGQTNSGVQSNDNTSSQTNNPETQANHSSMDHSQMDHSQMDHSQMDHGSMAQSQNNQSSTSQSSTSQSSTSQSSTNQNSTNQSSTNQSSTNQSQMDHSQMSNDQMNSNKNNMNQNETHDQHLMNNSQHQMNGDMSSMKENFPFSMLIAVLSYTFMLMLEKIIVKQSVCNHNGLNLSNKQESVDNQLKNQASSQFEIVVNQSKNTNNINNEDQNAIQLKCMNNDINLQQKDCQAPSEGGVFIINPNQQFDLESAEKNQQKGVVQNFDKLTTDKSQDVTQKQEVQQVQEVSNQKLLSIALIQFTFGLHAILEGISIGVQQQIGSALTIFAVILAHKWAMGLILGMTLKDSKLTLRFSTFMIILQSLMNPIGIAIGWALSQTGNLTIGILLSISAGTFLYISINNIIVDEFNQDRYKVTKFILYLIGIGLVAFLWNIENMSGGHSH